MSVQVPSSSAVETSVKRLKSTKRKRQDISQVVATPERSSSPTKKAKHFQEAGEALEEQPNDTPKADFQSKVFFLQTASFYLPIAPVSLHSAVGGLCAEHLSPLLLTYYPPLKGIILSYSNPRLTESPGSSSKLQKPNSTILALSIAEYGPTYLWLTADFLVLAPSAGSRIEGWINVQSETHLGLVCWNLFNATIPYERLPRDWKWIGSQADADSNNRKRKEKLKGKPKADEDTVMTADIPSVPEENQGHWVDGQGREISDKIIFNVVMIDADGGNEQDGNFVSIVGTLLSEVDEARLLEQENQLWEKRFARRNHPSKKTDNPLLGATQENNDTEPDTSKSKESSTKKRRPRQT